MSACLFFDARDVSYGFRASFLSPSVSFILRIAIFRSSTHVRVYDFQAWLGWSIVWLSVVCITGIALVLRREIRQLYGYQ